MIKSHIPTCSPAPIFACLLVAFLAVTSIVTGQSTAPATQPGGAPAAQNRPRRGALSVAFVCDAADSKSKKLDVVKRQLSAVIKNLGPEQLFSITFFQADQPAYFDKALLTATPENKEMAQKFLTTVHAAKTTDPVPALDMALKQHPQLIYILADHDFPNDDAVLQEIHKLNGDDKIKICTIAFADAGDHDDDFTILLKEIAYETGGTFKIVNLEDTGKKN